MAKNIVSSLKQYLFNSRHQKPNLGIIKPISNEINFMLFKALHSQIIVRYFYNITCFIVRGKIHTQAINILYEKLSPSPVIIQDLAKEFSIRHVLRISSDLLSQTNPNRFCHSISIFAFKSSTYIWATCFLNGKRLSVSKQMEINLFVIE